MFLVFIPHEAILSLFSVITCLFLLLEAVIFFHCLILLPFCVAPTWVSLLNLLNCYQSYPCLFGHVSVIFHSADSWRVHFSYFSIIIWLIFLLTDYMYFSTSASLTILGRTCLNFFAFPKGARHLLGVVVHFLFGSYYILYRRRFKTHFRSV